MAGIFAKDAGIWNYWQVTFQLRDKLMGGVPKDPKIIEGWLKTKGIFTNDEDIKHELVQTMRELGMEATPDMSTEEVFALQEEAAGNVSSVKNTNGFKSDEQGLYIEGRQLKAALKESANIMFGGERVGPTRKGFKNYVAERLMVIEQKVYLDRTQPDGIETVIGHVTGPQGPRSTLGYTEYCVQPKITFHVKELKVMQKGGEPPITDMQRKRLYTCMEEQGIGALRSMQHGRFDLVQLDEIKAKDAPELAVTLKDTEAAILEAAS